MDFYGNINLLNNEIQQVVFDSDGLLPVANVPVGAFSFFDKKLYVCVTLTGGTTPVWIELTNSITTYVHRQDTSATTWNITHNLNQTNVIIQIYDWDDNKMIIPDTIVPVDSNNITVTFSDAIQGRAIVMFGNEAA